jgi:hypothetical protein
VLTEDYIMRMINQALVVLRRILRMKEAGQHQQALQEIDQSLEQLLGLKADLITALDDESLLETLTQNDQLDVDRLYLVSELLKEEGEILIEMGREEEGYFSSLRSLNFFLEVALEGRLERFPPPQDRIQALIQRLEGIHLEADTNFRLYCYYEDEEQYADAERTLIELGSDTDLLPEIKKELHSFYERMLGKPENELADGGFSIAYIQKKLENLQDEG